MTQTQDDAVPAGLRPMRVGDRFAVAALIRQAFATIPVKLDPAPSALLESGDSIAEKLARGGGAVWDSAGLRGCVLWHVQDGGLYVGRLAVEPGWQGRGIARALLGEAETEARRLGVAKLLLGVRLELPGNRRMFKAAGFTEVRLQRHAGYDEPTFAEAEKVL